MLSAKQLAKAKNRWKNLSRSRNTLMTCALMQELCLLRMKNKEGFLKIKLSIS
jgi:hypothetical protein